MTAKKSQEESEQPAKVYQLDALADQLITLSNTTKDGFDRINTSVNTLLVKSDSQVTASQLADNIAAVKSTIDGRIDEEVKVIHLTYSPVKRYNQRLMWAIAGSVIVMVGNIIYLFYITRATG